MIAEVLAWDYSQRWWLGTLGTQPGKSEILKTRNGFLMGIAKTEKCQSMVKNTLKFKARIPDDGLVIQLKSSGGSKYFGEHSKRNWEILHYYLPDSDATEQTDRNLSNSTQFIGELKAITELLNKYGIERFMVRRARP